MSNPTISIEQAERIAEQIATALDQLGMGALTNEDYAANAAIVADALDELTSADFAAGYISENNRRVRRIVHRRLADWARDLPAAALDKQEREARLRIS